MFEIQSKSPSGKFWCTDNRFEHLQQAIQWLFIFKNAGEPKRLVHCFSRNLHQETAIITWDGTSWNIEYNELYPDTTLRNYEKSEKFP